MVGEIISGCWATSSGISMKEISCLGAIVERPSLKLPNPDSDQVAGNVMSAGEGVERLARDELLSDLPFELYAVGVVLGHGLHPLKARRSRSIPNLQAVHRQGRTPDRRPKIARRITYRPRLPAAALLVLISGLVLSMSYSHPQGPPVLRRAATCRVGAGREASY
jgi:hypothetical protein